MLSDFDVTIIGLGPVGSFAALLMENRGLKVLAIDRDIDIYSLPRAVSISDQGLRMAQEIDLDQIYIKNSTEVSGAEFVDKDLNRIGGTLDLKGFITSNAWPPMRFFHQPYTDRAIRDRLMQSSVTVLLEHEITEMKQEDDLVSLWVKDNKSRKIKSFTSRYLIGSDGGSSAVRNLLNIKQEDLNYNRDWVVIDIELLKPNQLTDKAIQICDSERLGTFIPAHLPFRRWEFMIHEGEDKEQFNSDEIIHRLINKWLSPSEYKIIRKAIYQFHSVLASKFRIGNCFLMGDAAHQNPPFMGEGLMSGYRDAYNLSWKLACVLKDNCSDELLDTYELERKPHAKFVVENSAGIGELMEAYADAKDPNDVPEELVSKGYGSFVLPDLDEGLFYGGKAIKEMFAGQLFPQIIMKKNDIIHERLDGILGKSFAIVSNQKIEINDNQQEFMDQLNFSYIELEEDLINANPWLQRFFEFNRHYLIRPDRYVYGADFKNITIEKLIEDLRSRMTF